jgi:hypothetical protein
MRIKCIYGLGCFLSVTCIAILIWKFSSNNISSTGETKIIRNTDNQNTPYTSTHQRPKLQKELPINSKSFDVLMIEWNNLKEAELSDRDKRHKRCQLIELMVKAGHYEDAKALALEAEEGLLRRALVHSLFSKTSDIKGALAHLTEPEFSSVDKEFVWSGIRKSLSNKDGSKRVLEILQSDSNLKGFEAQELLSGAISYIDPVIWVSNYYVDNSEETIAPSPEDRLRRLGIVMKNIEKLVAIRPDLKERAMFNLMMNTSDRMPKECLSMIENAHGNVNQTDLLTVTTDAITALFYVSPSHALSSIKNLDGKFDYSPAIVPGVQYWLENDSKAALEWLKNNGSSLDSKVFDKSSSTAAEFLLKKGRLNEAAQLIAQIADPVAREAGQEMIRTNESELYLVDAKKDLPAHLDYLTAANSTQPAYFIEKTFSHWIENDPVKAQEWYDKNWNSLSKEKAQYVAAAYASDAVKLRDPVTANHWLKFIMDAKVKERIQGKINSLPRQ